MRIAGLYSHNQGKAFIENHYPLEIAEVRSIITHIDAMQCRTKVSRERSSAGHLFYSPVALNRAFKAAFTAKGWHPVRINCDYPTDYYVNGYHPPSEVRRSPFREMDFVKNNVGVEVQLGKYAFMVYNVSAKMTIFHNLGYINAGIEIVPVKSMADQMSSGVSYFEQLVWDLTHRGVADIDIPVLILGIAPEEA